MALLAGVGAAAWVGYVLVRKDGDFAAALPEWAPGWAVRLAGRASSEAPLLPLRLGLRMPI